MPTKLEALSERIIEACWLAALVVTPLFFNVFSNRTFEPDKIAIVRTLSLIIILAWTIKGLEKWRTGGKAGERKRIPTSDWHNSLHTIRQFIVTNPIPSLAILFFAVYILATLTSIAPRLSVWGSYHRMEGLYTTGSYLAIFFSVFALLRSHEQIHRLITAVLIVSFPISLYGIFQHFGLELLEWGRGTSIRVTSTQGNPIFLAALLIMVAPLTVSRLMGIWYETNRITGYYGKLLLAGITLSVIIQIAAWWVNPAAGSVSAALIVIFWAIVGIKQPHRSLRLYILIGCYTVLLATHFLCILFTQSRGPVLGLFTGFFVFALLLTLVLNKRRWTAVIAVFGITAVLLLTIVALPNSPVKSKVNIPFVDRFGSVFEGTGRVRLLVWQGAVNLITSNPTRTLIGYGPETIFVALPPYYEPELRTFEGPSTFPDRAHNESFDLLMTTGVFGYVVYLSIFICLIYGGLKLLKIINSNLQRNAFLGFMLMGGAGGILFAYAVDNSWRFFGLAVPLGLITGLFVYLIRFGLSRVDVRSKNGDKSEDIYLRLLVIGLIAAIAAHFVEVQFSFGIAATRTYFWIYAGSLAAFLYVYHRQQTVSTSSSLCDVGAGREKGSNDTRTSSTDWHSATLSVLMCGIMITLVYNFYLLASDSARLFNLLLLFAFIWIFSGLIILAEGRTDSHSYRYPRILKSFGIYASITLIGTFLYAVVQKSIMSSGVDVGIIPVPYFISLLIVLIVLAGVLFISDLSVKYRVFPTGTLLVMIPAAVIFYFIIVTNVNVVRADNYFKYGSTFLDKGEIDAAIALYSRALELQPRQDYYYVFLARAQWGKGERTQSLAKREEYFRESERSVERALALNPLNVDHMANRARFYRFFADYASDSGQKIEHLQNASIWYEQALTRSPGRIQLWNEWGLIHFFMGDIDRSIEKFSRSLSLDSLFLPTYMDLGQLYMLQERWEEATWVYEKVIAQNDTSAAAHSGLGITYPRLGRFDDAIQANYRVLELKPGNHISHTNLALLYQHQGRTREALNHAQSALRTAPNVERPAVEGFIIQLYQQLGTNAGENEDILDKLK